MGVKCGTPGLQGGGKQCTFPGLLERVRITGLDEVYLVIGVNEAEQLADLLPIVYGRRPVLSVPFTFMEAIPGCGGRTPSRKNRRHLIVSLLRSQRRGEGVGLYGFSRRVARSCPARGKRAIPPPLRIRSYKEQPRSAQPMLID
jgi:hypothetical protein